MNKNLIRFWLLTFLLILTFLLRIIKLEELFYFTYDESVFAFVGRRIILWQHIPLIGGATPFGFHVAPYFYWFFALGLFLGNLNPIIWGYIGALIAMFTSFMSYVVGKALFSTKAGILAASFWTFSYLANVYDRHFWGLYFGPLFSLIVIYLLNKIIRGNQKFIYPLALFLGLIIHADLSYYVFLILTALTWIIFKLPVRRVTFIALGIIVLSFLPLVVFDIRHDFANTKPILTFLRQGKNTPGFDSQKFINNSLIFPQTFTRLIYPFGDNEISKQYSYCRTYIQEKLQFIPWYLTLASFITLVSFIFWNFKKGTKSGNSTRILGLLTVLYFLGVQIYGTIFRADIFEHYITGIFAVFLLIFAKIVSSFPKKTWLVVLALFITFNLLKLSQVKNSMGLSYKKQAIEYTMNQVGNEPFSLDSLSTCWKWNGYRYLFAVYGREPVKSYVDPNFAYLYGTTSVAAKHPQTVVTFVVHDFIEETDEFYKRYALFKSHEIKSAIFGNIEVVIMDNSSGWFD